MHEWVWAAATAAMAMISFLIMPTERAPQFGLDHDFTTSDPEFLSSIVGATGEPFSTGNSIVVLNNGDEFYPAMLDAIRGARRSITIEAYIYWSGEIGLEVAEVLAARSKAGVPVKILLDAVGSAQHR